MELRSVLPRGAAHGACPAHPLQTWRAHRRLGPEHSGMGDAGIRRRDGRHDPRHREPGLPRQGSRVCAQTVAFFGRVRGQQLPCNPMLETVHAVAQSYPELREIICFDDWNDFVSAGDDEAIRLPSVSPDDPVMIQYTSGTTGFPKGALLRHRGLLNNGADTAERMGVDPGDVFIVTMPLFHTGGCVCCVIGSVSKAATQVLLEAFDPALVLEMFGTYRGNAMIGVPTMLIAMLEHPTFPTTDLSSVKAICSGGSTVPAPLVRRFEEKLGASFTIVFGQTECSPVAAQTRTDDSVEDKANTIGLPLPNMETKIVDPNTGETVPIGTIGEFCTRGYHIMLGYLEKIGRASCRERVE